MIGKFPPAFTRGSYLEFDRALFKTERYKGGI